MNFFIAPVQGHTDAAWRHFHHKIYGGDQRYFTPFMRLEHGETRLKDLRDFTNSLNDVISLEPQVIFSNCAELDILVGSLVAKGANAVNLNLGCPFPPQMSKGRGAAFIRNIKEAEKLPEIIAKYPDVKFSIKMRVGMENPDEWKEIIGILNSLDLDNLYVHPRTARQKYSGELYLDSFAEILEGSKNPVVFNGEIKTVEDIDVIKSKFPAINGVMIARGILGRPSLISEYAEGNWEREKRLETMVRFHNELFEYYKTILFGESQIISKIKPFWEYAEKEIGRKAWKAIRKSTTLPKYQAAVASLN
ncbi:MAG: tRNA-dihydrouridine synthase family protein [Muribaculaceae bacterium]|nr:tRNA-dihydrouridine synthase family protein [Muribaculaceae bacterium]